MRNRKQKNVLELVLWFFVEDILWNLNPIVLFHPQVSELPYQIGVTWLPRLWSKVLSVLDYLSHFMYIRRREFARVLACYQSCLFGFVLINKVVLYSLYCWTKFRDRQKKHVLDFFWEVFWSRSCALIIR